MALSSSWTFFGLQMLSLLVSFHQVSSCSLACQDGHELATTKPVDTAVQLTFAANQTCSTVMLSLSCSGCASCGSNYIYSWPDSDLYVCSINDSFGPSIAETIPCSDLVFGNLSSSSSASMFEDYHCGWDDDSGRDICIFADSAMRGGIQVCQGDNSTTSTTTFATTTTTSLTLRQVDYACVEVPPDNSTQPEASGIVDRPGNTTDYNTTDAPTLVLNTTMAPTTSRVATTVAPKNVPTFSPTTTNNTNTISPTVAPSDASNTLNRDFSASSSCSYVGATAAVASLVSAVACLLS